MPLYELTPTSVQKIETTTFAEKGIKERSDLQRLLKAAIDVVADDCMVLAEEFCHWDESKRRIDLLCLDKKANLVVVEFKRDDGGAHMELQALRYAAMVSGMSFSDAVQVYGDHLADLGEDPAMARKKILDHLDWADSESNVFAPAVRAVLVAPDFDKEITTCVMWLNDCGLDVRCIRLQPHEFDGKTVLDVEQIIPLPQAEEYQIQIKQKTREILQRQERGPWTGEWFMNVGEKPHNGRRWEDCQKYGFMGAWGGKLYRDEMSRLQEGHEIFAYISGSGYVGAGKVLGPAVPVKDFVSPVAGKKLTDLRLVGHLNDIDMNDLDQTLWCVPIEWTSSVARENGVKGVMFMPRTVSRLLVKPLIADLRKRFVPKSS